MPATEILELLDDNPRRRGLIACLLANLLERQGEALKWFAKAADSGHVQAQYEMGLRFKEGRYGCRIDLSKAAFYFGKSAVAGHAESQFAYAVCLKEGTGNHFVEAQYQYAELKVGSHKQEEAYVYYKKAAIADHSLVQYACIHYQLECGRDAVFLLKSYYEEYVNNKHQVLNDKEQLLEKIIVKRTGKLDRKQRAVRTDCMEAHFYLGRISEEGKGIDVDLDCALFHYECAAKSMREADYRMGYMYEFGVGEVIIRDGGKAKTYYQRAADKGHELALQRLTWSHAFFSTFIDIRDPTPEKKQEKDCLVM